MPSQSIQEFRPELISRRGELLAWVFALLTGASLIFLRMRGDIPTAAIVFVVFLFLAAISISLGNWMDRQTIIRVEKNGISFQNGIRQVYISWDDIKGVRILPARWGKAVHVLGDKAHFEFNTIGEVKFQGDVKGRVGFGKGLEILSMIVKSSDLTEIEETKKGRYYARR